MSNAKIARKFLATLEPIASSVFFSREVFEAVSGLGLEPWPVYFMGRAAPLGAAPPLVVASTFFNFSPSLVEQSVRWDIASPEKVLELRDAAEVRTLQRILGDADVSRANELLRIACDACRTEGRPLFAAWAARPWPSEPLLALWQAATLLREYRGDGHIAALVTHEIDAVEALLLHDAYREGALSWMLQARAWGDEAYKAGTARLQKRGFVNADGSLTDGGMKFREMVELQTDRLAAAPFEALGTEKCEELLGLLTPPAAAIVQAKGVPRSLAHIAKDAEPVSR